MDYQEIKTIIDAKIEEYKPEILDLNDYIWHHPELSGEEFETSKMLVSTLRSHGYDVEYPFADQDTAFRAVIGDNNHNRKIALLAEYDALPALGHACGHCAIAAMAVCTGLVLKDLQNEFDADIHIIGTPAEETYGGKCLMAEQDVFRDYDFAILTHFGPVNDVRVDATALDANIFEFHGVAAHAAASPWDGKNALNAARLFFDATDMMRQHVTPDARLHGIIQHGGDAANIVPDHTSVLYYTRAAERSNLNNITNKVVKAAELAAEICECTITRSIPDRPFDNLRINSVGEAALGEALDELGLEWSPERDAFGSTDIGNVSHQCPAFHPMIKLCDSAIHSVEFADACITDVGHNCIINGSKMMAYAITKIFTDADRYNAMKNEFSQGQ